MHKQLTRTISALAGLAALTAKCAEPVHDYPIRPVPAHRVRFEDAFWRPRLEINRTATIPLAFQLCEETGRIENFKVAGGLSDKNWAGMFGFNDSDVYKIAEGAAYSLMLHPDPTLKAYLNRLVSYIAAAQEKDGYLYTAWTARSRIADPKQIKCCVPGEKKWLNEKDSHELYNVGHMFEAAVAHWEATGNASFLNVAKKNADLLVATFGPGKIELPPGHPELELALVKLYRATGDEHYLTLAKDFINVRGRPSKERPELWGENRLDDKPLTEQQEGSGHAVRAVYLYAGATDVAALTGDPALLATVDRLWKNVVEKKTYVTGGIGARREGEAFGKEFELPNDTAYAETCANVATCLWNHRMFLLHGDGKYIDALERSLYNGSISGVALDGKTFFYPNPLSSAGKHARSKWFDCSCCPTTICRFMPSVPGYTYATRDDALYVNLFVAGTADVEMAGKKVHVSQETAYPWDGRVTIKLAPESGGQHITLKVRIPGWARGRAYASNLYRFADDVVTHYTLSVNGKAIDSKVVDGYATVERKWQPDDTVTLELPMQVRRVIADEEVEADRGRVALMRGPLVYCVEWPDVDGGKVLDLSLSDKATLTSEFRKGLLGGVEVIKGTARRTVSTKSKKSQASGDKSREHASKSGDDESFVAIPYYAWANRGQGEMVVWLKRLPAK